jgi:glycerophosphoryl diester phosphodiesterase
MKVVAHRGYSARFPENSALAFEQAIVAGADYLETDVRLAADDALVCWHDADFGRVAGNATPIATTPAAEIARIELPHAARVHRLEEVLAIARSRIPVMLDVKVDDDAARAAIIRSVTAAGMMQQVIYGVRHPRHAYALDAEGAPCARLAMPAEPDMLSEFPLQRLIGARLWEDQVSDDAVARIRALGIAVWVTAGFRKRGEQPGYIDAERLRRLRDAGIDAVLVNDVELAVAIAHE